MNEQQRSHSLLATMHTIAKTHGGQVGKVVLQKYWSKTELGPMEQWPTCLLSAMSMILLNNFPFILYWGPKFRVLYNDGYIPIFGPRHPTMFGEPAKEAWGEIWFAYYCSCCLLD